MFMKVSNMSPFIVIPSPEGVKESKPAKKIKPAEASSTFVEEENLSKEEKHKVISIGAYQEQAKKRKKTNTKANRQKVIDSYSKVLTAEHEELLKDNFKKKI